MTVATLGEMAVDKTPWIGNRTDGVALAGRAVLGAAVGALVASEQDHDVVGGAIIGAAVSFPVKRTVPTEADGRL